MGIRRVRFQAISLIKLLKGRCLTYIYTEVIAKKVVAHAEIPHQPGLSRTFLPYAEKLGKWQEALMIFPFFWFVVP